MEPGEDVTRFGVVRMNEDCRIEDFEEKPMVSSSHTISTGIYVIRRRQLIEPVSYTHLLVLPVFVFKLILLIGAQDRIIL